MKIRSLYSDRMGTNGVGTYAAIEGTLERGAAALYI